MKKIAGTRIESEEEEQFEEKVKKYTLSKSALLRLFILAFIKNDARLMPVIMEIIQGREDANKP